MTARSSTAWHDCVDDAVAFLGRRSDRQGSITTPYPELDARSGPLEPNQVIVIASDPKSGRTSMALDVCRSAAFVQGKSCLLVSPSHSERELTLRLLAGYARIDHYGLRTGRRSPDQQRRWEAAIGEAKAIKLHIRSDDSTEGPDLTLGPEWLAHDLDLIVIDDIDHYSPDVARSMWRVAEALQVPIVMTAELLPYYRSEPDLSGSQRLPLKGEAAGIDRWIVVQPADQAERPCEADIYVWGREGEPEKISLCMQLELSRFTSYATSN